MPRGHLCRHSCDNVAMAWSEPLYPISGRHLPDSRRLITSTLFGVGLLAVVTAIGTRLARSLARPVVL